MSRQSWWPKIDQNGTKMKFRESDMSQCDTQSVINMWNVDLRAISRGPHEHAKSVAESKWEEGDIYGKYHESIHNKCNECRS